MSDQSWARFRSEVLLPRAQAMPLQSALRQVKPGETLTPPIEKLHHISFSCSCPDHYANLTHSDCRTREAQIVPLTARIIVPSQCKKENHSCADTRHTQRHHKLAWVRVLIGSRR